MITITKEQAQQIEDVLWTLEQHNKLYYGETHNTVIEANKALATIRAARAQEQAEQEPLVRFCPVCGSIGEVDSKYRDCCPDGIKARLVPSRFAEECQGLFNLAIGNVAPVREPVKWTDAALLNLMNSVGDGPFGEEDLAVIRRFMERAEEIRQGLYAAPIRTKDLTDAEIADIGTNCGTSMWSLMFAHAGIAPAREKNK